MLLRKRRRKKTKKREKKMMIKMKNKMNLNNFSGKGILEFKPRKGVT